ncbi:uncharacterized protein LOC128963199, partial [Oppia nitens]|uniref:uncharacterized protein LOC128963199 n=1 Tax=Oppia nitens TaxID=1686743 RepID=UPI0023DACC5A
YIKYSQNPTLYKPYERAIYKPDVDIHGFHKYAIEWSETKIEWFFDDKTHNVIDINKRLSSNYNKKHQPFDVPYNLYIELTVGGTVFGDQSLTLNDYNLWNCSALLIDYVKIYEWVDNFVDNNVDNDKHKQISSHLICNDIMSTIGGQHNPTDPLSTFTLSMTNIVIVSIITLILLIILVMIVVYLSLRQKRLTKINRDIVKETYDDIEVYDKDYNIYESYRYVTNNNIIYDQYNEIIDDNNNNDYQNKIPEYSHSYIEITNQYKV